MNPALARLIKPLAVLTVLLLVGGMAGLVYAGRKKDAGFYEITAYFDKGIGLYENGDVTILGVAIGKITVVEPEGTRVRVEMQIPKEYKLPADVNAQVVPISVISDRYVQLFPVYEGGPTLEEGAVLDTDRTQIPAELDDVFKQLKKLLDAIDPGKPGEPGALGSLIVQLNKALADKEADLRGTLTNTAALTGTLSDAQEDLDDILVNFDDLFSTLATRAGSFDELNRNFALVMIALAQSREDLEGTLVNLGDMTNEVADLVKTHRVRLGQDLALATRLTSVILENRASIEESQQWLPVVAQGLTNAFHKAPVLASDVRDNALSARCNDLESIPKEIRDILKPVFEELCGAPDEGRTAPTQPGGGPTIEEILTDLDCDKEVRKVRRQLKRLSNSSLSEAQLDQIIPPLNKKLRELKRECKALAETLKDPDSVLNEIIDQIDAGSLDDVDSTLDGGGTLDDLTGSAASTSPAPTTDEPGAVERVGDWVNGFFGFVGWSR